MFPECMEYILLLRSHATDAASNNDHGNEHTGRIACTYPGGFVAGLRPQ